MLRCAPLHHHFQFLGWPENKIVVRFWIASALCALLARASLKLGVADGAPENRFHSEVVNLAAQQTRVQWHRESVRVDADEQA